MVAKTSILDALKVEQPESRVTLLRYAWTLSDKLPVIPIPLKPGDADASVPLQEVFDIVYQRARYDLSVKYNALLDPPLNPNELRWWVQSPSGQS